MWGMVISCVYIYIWFVYDYICIYVHIDWGTLSHNGSQLRCADRTRCESLAWMAAEDATSPGKAPRVLASDSVVCSVQPGYLVSDTLMWCCHPNITGGAKILLGSAHQRRQHVWTVASKEILQISCVVPLQGPPTLFLPLCWMCLVWINVKWKIRLNVSFKQPKADNVHCFALAAYPSKVSKEWVFIVPCACLSSIFNIYLALTKGSYPYRKGHCKIHFT